MQRSTAGFGISETSDPGPQDDDGPDDDDPDDDDDDPKPSTAFLYIVL